MTSASLELTILELLVPRMASGLHSLLIRPNSSRLISRFSIMASMTKSAWAAVPSTSREKDRLADIRSAAALGHPARQIIGGPFLRFFHRAGEGIAEDDLIAAGPVVESGVHGDLLTHGSGADYNDGFDLFDVHLIHLILYKSHQDWNHSFSMIVAMDCPPPMHRVASPYRPPVR